MSVIDSPSSTQQIACHALSRRNVVAPSVFAHAKNANPQQFPQPLHCSCAPPCIRFVGHAQELDVTGSGSNDMQRELDEALAATFPASDPPAKTAPSIATAQGKPQPSDDERKVVDLFRVVPRSQAQAAFTSSENRTGGRWTSEGVPAVYTSLSPGGAILEFVVHLDGEKPVDLMLVSARLPGSCIETAKDLPQPWKDFPYRDEVREWGDAWIASQRAPALQLPSVICEGVQNLLVNPRHPDVGSLDVVRIEPFTLDPRLLKG
jgi:RES domain-containing protein